MIIPAGTQDNTIYFYLKTSTGAAATGLTIADLDATYVRDKASAIKADLTALAAVDSAHGDNKAIEISSTNAPGLYRVDFPDAAFVAGVDRVQLVINGAAIDPAVIEVELTVLDTIEDALLDLQDSMGLLAPLSDAADSEAVTYGSVIAGSYVNTQTDDDNRYTLAPEAVNGLDVTLTFNLGTDRAPTAVGINGYWNGSSQYCDVYVLDALLSVWDKLTNSSTRMSSRNSDANYAYPLNREHIDPDTGDIKVRFVSTSTNTGHRLYLDRVLVNTVANSTGAAGAGGGGITAQDIWVYATRTLTTEAGEPATSTEIAEAVMSSLIEGTITLQQAMEVLLAVLVGKASGGGTTTITFRNTEDNTDRVVMTVDEDGNRSSVVLTL